MFLTGMSQRAEATNAHCFILECSSLTWKALRNLQGKPKL